ncbi:hypothetical protein GYMC10_0159 [Paenibacillus sp. Y412MC10]|nr:hypothetical protein GYMC10_0159 [Paenibacillus sp. Y412MC10]ETT63743.1 hypothetical protein C172_15604 [Paenibacillus sp. FSL H8-457]
MAIEIKDILAFLYKYEGDNIAAPFRSYIKM